METGTSRDTTAEAAAQLRAQLRAAGALVGVEVTVTDDEAWLVTPDTVQVGLGWYAARGHGALEAGALALLDLWQYVRGWRIAADRARRQRSVVRAFEHLGPLVGAIARVQAANELLESMPGVRGSLAAAMWRQVSEPAEQAGATRTPQPRHLQWVTLVLMHGFGFGPDAGSLDPAVHEELLGLAAAAPEAVHPADVLRRALAVDPSRGALTCFERALALLLPPYERLLRLDAQERGLADAGAAVAQEHEGGANAEDFGAAGGGDAEAEASGADDADAAEGAEAAPGDGDRARAGEGRERAEGADLFAAEQAAYVTSFLSTPMPGDGALVDPPPEFDLATMERDARDSQEQSERAERPGAAGPAGAARAASDYLARAEELRESIERMRDVWAQVITERVAERRIIGRRAQPEGEVLSAEALARVVIESRAGVAHPAGFLRREHRSKPDRRDGSTDYVLLVDRSASMQGRLADAAADTSLIMLEALAGADRDIAHAERTSGLDLDLDIRTALVLFDAEPTVVKPLSRGLDDEARRRMHQEARAARGSTNDGAALREAGTQLGVLPGAAAPDAVAVAPDGTVRRRLVFVISDGGSNDPAAAAAVLQRLRGSGVEVHGIGVGADDIVSRYAPHSVRVDDPARIADVVQQLIEGALP